MRVLLLNLTLVSAFIGCHRAETNALLQPPADQKARVEEILRERGIQGNVSVLRPDGDGWEATILDSPTVVDESNKGRGMQIKAAGPRTYRVHGDGRVEASQAEKAQTGRL